MSNWERDVERQIEQEGIPPVGRQQSRLGAKSRRPQREQAPDDQQQQQQQYIQHHAGPHVFNFQQAAQPLPPMSGAAPPLPSRPLVPQRPQQLASPSAEQEEDEDPF